MYTTEEMTHKNNCVSNIIDLCEAIKDRAFDSENPMCYGYWTEEQRIEIISYANSIIKNAIETGNN